MDQWQVEAACAGAAETKQDLGHHNINHCKQTNLKMSANDRSPGNKRRYDDKISGHMEKASEVNEDFNKIMEDIAKMKSSAVERSGHPVTLYRYSSVPNFVDAGQIRWVYFIFVTHVDVHPRS